MNIGKYNCKYPKRLSEKFPILILNLLYPTYQNIIQKFIEVLPSVKSFGKSDLIMFINHF